MGSLFKRKDAGGKTGRWYATFTDHTGRRVLKCTKTRDKRTAQSILEHWETEAAKRTSGLIDPRAERTTQQASRPLKEHQSEFLNKLRVSGCTEKYVHQVDLMLTRAFSAMQVERLIDLTAEGLEKHLNELKVSGLSARTLASVITAVKGFVKWACESDRMAHNPLQRIRKPRTQTDRRLERRPFTPDEWRRLLENCQGECFGIDAVARRLLYETALQTALRSSELRAVTIENTHLAVSPPFIVVNSGRTKNKQLARQYLTTELAGRLAGFADGRRGPLFQMPRDYEVVDMLRHDMAAARIAIKDGAGRQIDFHAIRHTCGTWLAQSGVHPKAIQSIMRHSDIRLTLDTYGHLFPSQEAEAIVKLAAMQVADKKRDASEGDR